MESILHYLTHVVLCRKHKINKKGKDWNKLMKIFLHSILTSQSLTLCILTILIGTLTFDMAVLVLCIVFLCVCVYVCVCVSVTLSHRHIVAIVYVLANFLVAIPLYNSPLNQS